MGKEVAGSSPAVAPNSADWTLEHFVPPLHPPRTHADPRGRSATASTRLSGGCGRPLASASSHDASRLSPGGGVCRSPARALPCRRAARQSGAGQPTSCRLCLASSALRLIRRPGQGPVLVGVLAPLAQALRRARTGARAAPAARRPSAWLLQGHHRTRGSRRAGECPAFRPNGRKASFLTTRAVGTGHCGNHLACGCDLHAARAAGGKLGGAGSLITPLGIDSHVRTDRAGGPVRGGLRPGRFEEGRREPDPHDSDMDDFRCRCARGTALRWR